MQGVAQTFDGAIGSVGLTRDLNAFYTCTCTAAFLRVSRGWIPFFIRIRVEEGRDSRSPRQMLTLGELKLCEERHAVSDVFDGLKKETPSISVAGQDWPMGATTWHYTSPRETWHSWYPEKFPCYHLSGDPSLWNRTERSDEMLAEVGRLLHDKVPSDDKHYFVCIEDAIDWWMSYPKALRIGNRQPIPHIQMTIPLCPGRICGITLNESDTVKVSLHPGYQESESTVILAGVFGGEYKSFRRSPKEARVTFPKRPDGDFAIHVVISGKTHATYKGNASQIPYEDRGRSSGWSIDDLLKNGETEHCEYKLFGDPAGASFKDGEFRVNVIENIAAFANGGGGILLFGVNDHGDAVGIEPTAKHLASFLKCESSKVRTRVERHIRKIVSDSLIQAPTYTTDWIDYLGLSILVIEIQSNTPDRITKTHQEVIYVRRGATTRRAIPEEIHKLYSRRDKHVKRDT